LTTYQNALLSMGVAYLLHRNLGNIHKEKGKYELAIYAYGLAIQMAPNH
jgi:tetratricopeptide (TPR) repeat protein